MGGSSPVFHTNLPYFRDDFLRVRTSVRAFLRFCDAAYARGPSFGVC